MTNSTAAIHVAKKQLGLDDDTYRAKLQKITGKSSTKAMSEPERQKVLQVFRNEGFAPAPAARRPDGRAKLTGKYAKKMQALWIAGWNLGVIHDRDDAALRKFIVGRAPIDAAEWLRFAGDAKKAIEPLKIMLARDGGVDWGRSQFMPPYTQVDGFRIAHAQWKTLRTLDAETPDFNQAVRQIAGGPPSTNFTDQEWIMVMNELGKRVRKLQPMKGT